MLCSTAAKKACRGLFSASGPAGSFDSHVQHRMWADLHQIRVMNFRGTTAPFTISADHRASLSWLTRPLTQSSMTFLFTYRAGSGSLLCGRLPSDIVSRLCPCLSLVVAAPESKQVVTDRELAPLSSYPCWAYTVRGADCGGRGIIFMPCQFQRPVFDQTLTRPRSRTRLWYTAPATNKP